MGFILVSQMVSVERVLEYTKLEPEANLESAPGKNLSVFFTVM